MALLSKFFGRAASEGAAYAMGLATGPALSPAVQELVNEAWRTHPSKTLDAGAAAEIVAEDVELRDWGADEAAAHGIDGNRFDALLGAVLNAPGLGELFSARRRGLINAAQFHHGLRKAKLEAQWDDALVGLLDVLLTPAELANARQQGYIDAGRQRSEAERQGVNADRAEIQYQMVGMPPGPAEGLTMLRRGIIDEATFAQMVREGRTKTKYTDELLALRDVVLSPTTYATLHLKGWIDEAAMIAGGALSGESADNMRKMYLAMGRPPAPGQMFTAWARGIHGPAGRPMDEAQFTKAIAESDIRPEYAPMLWGIRYAYPPLFQITRLVTAGTITPATAVDWAQKDRYAPEVVNALRQAWESGGATTAKGLTVTDVIADYEGHLATRAQTITALRQLGYSQASAGDKLRIIDAKRRRTALRQLLTRAHSRYTAWRINDAAARQALDAAEVPRAEQDALLLTWKAEREINQADLTPAQIKKAVKKALMPRDEAVAELEARGYDEHEANTLLDE